MKEDGGNIISILAHSWNQTSKSFVWSLSLSQRRSSKHGVGSIIRRSIAHNRTQTLKAFVWIPLFGPIGSKHSIIIIASIVSSKSSSITINISILIITRLTMSSPKHSVIIITRSRSCILQLARKTTLSMFQNETKDVGPNFCCICCSSKGGDQLTHVRSFSTVVLINPRLTPDKTVICLDSLESRLKGLSSSSGSAWLISVIISIIAHRGIQTRRLFVWNSRHHHWWGSNQK